MIGFFKHRDRICREDSGLAPQETSRPDDVIDDMAAYMLVNSGENIVKDVDISAGVYGAGEL